MTKTTTKAKPQRATPEPPKPLRTELKEQIMEIRSRIHGLLVQSNPVYTDSSNSSIVFIGASSYWAALADDGRAMQSELRKDAKRWFDLVEQLVADRSEQVVGQAKEIRKFCEQVLDQTEAMHERSTHEMAKRLWHELDEQLIVVKGCGRIAACSWRTCPSPRCDARSPGWTQRIADDRFIASVLEIASSRPPHLSPS
jgi:ElaB/YqjD/DUF883 family membrane-anchored ribosome-binding protein